MDVNIAIPLLGAIWLVATGVGVIRSWRRNSQRDAVLFAGALLTAVAILTVTTAFRP